MQSIASAIRLFLFLRGEQKRCPQQPTFTWCQERLSQATHRYVHRAHGRAPVAQQTKEAFWTWHEGIWGFVTFFSLHLSRWSPSFSFLGVSLACYSDWLLNVKSNMSCWDKSCLHHYPFKSLIYFASKSGSSQPHSCGIWLVAFQHDLPWFQNPGDSASRTEGKPVCDGCSPLFKGWWKSPVRTPGTEGFFVSRF